MDKVDFPGFNFCLKISVVTWVIIVGIMLSIVGPGYELMAYYTYGLVLLPIAILLGVLMAILYKEVIEPEIERQIGK